MAAIKKPTPNRSKIDIGRKDDVKHWAKHLGVSEERLRKAVEKVGNAAVAVRKELRSQRVKPGRVSSDRC